MRHSSWFFLFLFFFILSFGRVNFVRFSPGKEGAGTHTIANPPCASLHLALFACGDVVVHVGNVRDIQFTVDCLPRHTRREPHTKSTRKYTKKYLNLCITFFRHSRRARHTVVDRCEPR